MSIDKSAAATEAAVSFSSLNLAGPLVQAVAELGYTAPTAVQAATIPASMAGGDWMVSSQTGSGKTAAFLLPALHALLSSPSKQKEPEQQRGRIARGPASFPQVLVLAPTRELAQQVSEEAIQLVRFARGVRIATVVGGTPFPKQVAELRGASLVVATPGRLLDLHRNNQISLDHVHTLVVDEADRMLDLGFSEDLEAIHQATSKRDRTLMFSATFAPRIMHLAANVMRDPQKIELSTAQDSHQNIEQRLHWFDDMAHKTALLEHCLADTKLVQAVIFTATQIDADDLSDRLRDAGYSATALHGAMPQAIRNRRIQSLRDGSVQILVATDVAARGIDVPSISHVINYGLPMKPEDYTHRIGRTGRAGRDGIAITLAGGRDRYKVRNIERFINRTIAESTVEGLEPKNVAFSKPSRSFSAHAPRDTAMRSSPAPRQDRGDRDSFRARPSYSEGRPSSPRPSFGDRGAPRPAYQDRAPRPAYADRGERAPAPAFARREESFAPRQERGFDNRVDSRPPRDGAYKPAYSAERNSAPRPTFGERNHDRAPRTDYAERNAAPRSPWNDRSDRSERPASRAPEYAPRERPAREFEARAPRNDYAAAPRREYGNAAAAPAKRSSFDTDRADRAPRAAYATTPEQAAGASYAADRADKYAAKAAYSAGPASKSPAKFGAAPKSHAAKPASAPAKVAGPAHTPPKDGGNRAARRAALQASFGRADMAVAGAD
jgi:superfamily II DNA/RNA helicase